jgi:hypothetical protein
MILEHEWIDQAVKRWQCPEICLNIKEKFYIGQLTFQITERKMFGK